MKLEKNTACYLEKLETSFSYTEVAYLSTLYPAGDEAVEIKFANLIAEVWRGRLKLLYPTQAFQVNVLTPEQVGSVWSMEFYEIRAAGPGSDA